MRDGTLPGRVDVPRIPDEDLTVLTFGDASFEFVVSLEVLEHIAEYRARGWPCGAPGSHNCILASPTSS